MMLGLGLVSGCGGHKELSEPAVSTSDDPPTGEPEPSAVRADELGQIPVLMIHQIEDHPSGDFAQTAAQLRSTLEYLAGHDYVPITAAELVGGDIDVPAGASPVVLTFDDGSANQFQLSADGSVDPDSGVGVVLGVAERHPRFRPVGTMYVNRMPFGKLDASRELRWLVEHGWEVGNHSYGHENLASLPSAAVQKTIADDQRMISKAVPGYGVTTLALPFGIMPERAQLARRGSSGGVRYDYRGVMLVGANPAPSPFAADWDPFNIPRIRSWYGRTEYDEHYWLPKLLRTRYVSDGDPAKVSFPRSAARSLAAPFTTHANPY
jgi:peptidoglycan/xylan/chitin deacetylase (PgdA/CDA1 family)